MTKPFAVPKALVWAAFQRVKANGGSAGVDDESIAKFEDNLGDNLYKLWNRMASGSYFPPPVKAVPIPKKSGGVRILGVPTVADRVAQTVVKTVLEPVLESVFDRDSFGYRPGRSALDAVALVMHPIAAIARANLAGTPQITKLKLGPKRLDDVLLVAAANGMAQAAALYTQVFLDHKLPPDFIAELQAASDAVQRAVATRNAAL